MAANKTIGEIGCQCCGKTVPLREQKNGLAIYACGYCGFTGQSHQHKSTHILKGIMAQIEPGEETTAETPELETVGGDETPPAKTPAKKKNMWGI